MKMLRLKHFLAYEISQLVSILTCVLDFRELLLEFYVMH